MRWSASIVRCAAITATSLLLTHPTPSIAGSAPPADTRPSGYAVAPESSRPGFNFLLGLETDVFGVSGAPRPLDRLSALEQAMISRSADGLFEVFHRDGSATIDLQGRFQEFSFARIGSDGRLIYSCMDEYAGVRAALLAAQRSSAAWEER